MNVLKSKMAAPYSICDDHRRRHRIQCTHPNKQFLFGSCVERARANEPIQRAPNTPQALIHRARSFR